MQDITPPGVHLHGTGVCDYGVQVAVLDPRNPSTVYVGTCNYGIWKSTDCGSTWTNINTGTNGDHIQNSSHWTLVIDPVDPQVLYTNAGYNRVNAARSGLFKTTNGGVDWTEIWPPKDKAHANLLGHNLVTQVNINPGNNLHLLLGFHEVCAPPHSQACFAETRDGGNTWTIHNGDPRWQFSHSQTPYIIDDQTWLFANHD
ncbi:MAG TPA: hypothetical protein VFA64_02330, partial [Hyphomicrobiaceae bacterium]|nr:hypothetical protein [Hyphomicrobiaceae bacterium]